MSYYDPTRWVKLPDTLVVAIEDKVRTNKKAQSSNGRTAGAFLPPNYLDLDVIVEQSGEILRLTEWIDKIGRTHITLSDSNQLSFRRGDFRVTEHHHNPSGVDIPPPHHIHFPTVDYPLNGTHTYAYPTNSKVVSDYIGALNVFCNVNNIILDKIHLPLLRFSR